MSAVHPLSPDVVAALKECRRDGLTPAAAARYCGVPESTARSQYKRFALADSTREALARLSPGAAPDEAGRYVCARCRRPFSALCGVDPHSVALPYRPYQRLGGQCICDKCASARFRRRQNPLAVFGNQ